MSDPMPGVPPTPLPPTHQSLSDDRANYPSPGYQASTYTSPTYESLTTTTTTTPSRRRSTLGPVIALVLTVMVLLAGAGAGVFFFSEWVGQQQGANAGGPGAPAEPGAQPVAPLPLSVAGFEQFLDALQKENGSTKVVDATLYPDYASIQVLLPGGKGRTRSLYYQGTFRETTLGTTTAKELDLSRVDAALLVKLSKKARKLVEDPNQWYFILRAPDPEGAAIAAYASNEYGEGGYLSARLDGKIVRRVTW